MFFRKSAPIDAIGEEIVRATLERFGEHGLDADRFALTMLLHPAAGRAFGEGATLPEGYSYRGGEPFYPCSVVKMFYLVAAQAAFEAGRVAETAELDRAMHDMIKWSSNTATNYIIDVLTGTTGDTDLDPAEMPAWIEARNSINAYFQGFGLPEFAGINVSQKLMDDDRYGREKTFVRLGGNNHNRLTTDAAASMMARIMDGSMVSPQRSQAMADYLYRPRDKAFVQTSGAQVLNYMGADLPEGAEFWSKAGWTGWTRDPLASYRRHDAIHVALPTGRRFTLVAFTQGERISADPKIMPFIGRKAAELVAAS
ncbi:serine hydrolase [Labrys monachus]|uniref:beta-lactamase n=1 Tax=Labrys monachus TaxID=217067 RepID=A0ABU0F940_9HYPH|nr:serine hydrolase [Labrys monachus]MDQ0391117.1 beta-lactamase class A [Labrys monachus]